MWCGGTQAGSGVPLAILLIAGLPKSNLESWLLLYFAVTVVFGVLIAWCGSGCNSPLFAEIVPVQKRSLIYAFDRCFEVCNPCVVSNLAFPTHHFCVCPEFCSLVVTIVFACTMWVGLRLQLTALCCLFLSFFFGFELQHSCGEAIAHLCLRLVVAIVVPLHTFA